MTYVPLSGALEARLRCPACGSSLAAGADLLTCTTAQCARTFPVVNGIPVLIDEAHSVFSLADFVRRRNTTFHINSSRRERILQRLLDLVPGASSSRQSDRNYRRFTDALLAQTARPRVLIVGGSIQGAGMDAMVVNPSVEIVATDVSFGPFTTLICDAHAIPFDEGTFDGVVTQAVLEHVVDPSRCVDEIHRVLKDHGLVYAETPFIQQVHMGPYDFTRYTHSGHRRLFRRFTEIASGPVGGPGMALAWSYQYFLLSFSRSRAVRGLIRAFTGLTSFFLRYADEFLIDKPGAIDAASGFYFLGQKQGVVLSDRDLVAYYRGSVST